MTDKPEIVAEVVPHGIFGFGVIKARVDAALEVGAHLIRLTDHEASRAADKARIAELVEALGSMTCAYRMAIQAGHARITALGGDCDSVDRMLADFPDYGSSIELYKSCRAALAQQGKEGGV